MAEELFSPVTVTKRADVIKAVRTALAKRALDVRKRLEDIHVQRSVIRRVDKNGAVEFMVKHQYGAAGFRTYADAAGYALAVFRAQNPSMYSNDGDDFKRDFTDSVMATLADDDDEQSRANAEAATHLNAGNTAAIDDPTSNADPLLGHERARAKINAASKSQKRV